MSLRIYLSSPAVYYSLLSYKPCSCVWKCESHWAMCVYPVFLNDAILHLTGWGIPGDTDAGAVAWLHCNLSGWGTGDCEKQEIASRSMHQHACVTHVPVLTTTKLNTPWQNGIVVKDLNRKSLT